MPHQLTQGLQIMGIGMSVVFSFLLIMVLTMNLNGMILRVLNRIFPEPIEETPSGPDKKDEEIAVAIAAVYAKK